MKLLPLLLTSGFNSLANAMGFNPAMLSLSHTSLSQYEMMQLMSKTMLEANEHAHEELSRSTRYNNDSPELCQAVERTMPMKTFIESYLCPSLRIALAGFCIGRSSECFSCKGIGPSMEQKWTYTKCKPNRELMNHQICSHDAMKLDFCPTETSDFTNCPYRIESDLQDVTQEKQACCWKKLYMGEKLTCKTLMNTNPEFELNRQAIEQNREDKLAYQTSVIPVDIEFNKCLGDHPQRSQCMHSFRSKMTLQFDVQQPKHCCASLAWV